MKKPLLTAFLIIFVAIVTFPLKAAAEGIKKFEAVYELEQSGIVRVTENISYDFGTENRHGIYRFVPFKYRLNDDNFSYLNFNDFLVTDFNGNRYEFRKQTQGTDHLLVIGDPDRTTTGVNDYRITYTVKGGLRYLEDGDEFNWNVNGFVWEPEVATSNISAVVHLPKNIASEDIRTSCYKGEYGSERECEQRDISGNKITFTDQNLAPGEGLSIVVGVPKGSFERLDGGFMGSGISDSLLLVLVLVAAAFPVATFVFMLFHWWRRGRDPKGRGTIIPEYEAPFDLTPIEVGTLLDNRVDSKDLSAEIIYLATKGLVSVKRIEGKGLLKKDDYLLTRLSANPSLSKHDETLIDGIFDQGAEEVLISELKNKFYTHVQEIKGQVHYKLVSDGYFRETVASTIGKYLVVAFLIGFVGYWVGSAVGSFTNGVGTIIFSPAFILSGIIVGLFGLAMPARTAKGVEAKERILGLREYLSVAESDRLKFHNAPKKDPRRFEEMLPYAMVLGVEKEWAQQFEGIYDGSPSWYTDPTGSRFVPIVFVNQLNSFSAIATQDMTSMPSSSGSGFGGGGFSGGGFGGGGGGSW